MGPRHHLDLEPPVQPPGWSAVLFLRGRNRSSHLPLCCCVVVEIRRDPIRCRSRSTAFATASIAASKSPTVVFVWFFASNQRAADADDASAPFRRTDIYRARTRRRRIRKAASSASPAFIVLPRPVVGAQGYTLEATPIFRSRPLEAVVGEFFGKGPLSAGVVVALFAKMFPRLEKLGGLGEGSELARAAIRHPTHPSDAKRA